MNKNFQIIGVSLPTITLLVWAMFVPERAFSEPGAISSINTLDSQTRLTTQVLIPVESNSSANSEFSNVENDKLPIENYSYQRLDTPAKLNKYMRMLTQNIAKDIDAARTGEVLRQAGYILKAADDLSSRNMEHPVSCKFIVPSLCQSYSEAVRLLQEGARTKDRAKMRLGLEKLERANNCETWHVIQQAHGKAQTNQSNPASAPQL